MMRLPTLSTLTVSPSLFAHCWIHRLSAASCLEGWGMAQIWEKKLQSKLGLSVDSVVMMTPDIVAGVGHIPE